MLTEPLAASHASIGERYAEAGPPCPREGSQRWCTASWRTVLCALSLLALGYLAGASSHQAPPRAATVLAGQTYATGEHGDGAVLGEKSGKSEELTEKDPTELVQMTAVALVTLVVLLLLRGFEHLVEWLNEHLAPALRPVINTMLAELAGVGTIGLLLKLLLAFFGSAVEDLSIVCFGEGETLVEAFEFIHTRIFEVAVLFFVVNGKILGDFIRNEQRLTAAVLKADADGDGKVTPSEFMAAFGASSLAPERKSAIRQLLGGFDPVVDAYLFRRRFRLANPLPPKWGFAATGAYNEAYAAMVIVELVEFNPLTWLPFVPIMAILEQVKIAHGVVGEDSSGAVVGAYFHSPVMPISCAFTIFGLCWGWFNFAKLARVKEMVKPRALTDAQGRVEVCRPALYEDADFQKYLSEHRGLVRAVDVSGRLTRYLGSADHEHHRLFGSMGHRAPHFFLQSIKYHTWVLVLGLTFGLQITLRDAITLSSSGTTAAPPGAVAELLTFGLCVLAFLAMLLVVTPTTCAMFILSTTVEGFTQEWAIRLVSERHGWLGADGRPLKHMVLGEADFSDRRASEAQPSEAQPEGACYQM